MIQNYIKVAWRTLLRSKVYTLLNVWGLTLGICSCMVIGLVVQYEFSFDNFHPDKERIYRVGTFQQFTKDDPQSFLPSVAPSFAEALQAEVSGITTAAPYHVLTDASASVPAKGPGTVFPATLVVTAPAYFSVMHYDWLAGNAQAALSQPYQVVLSEEKAHTYFGPLAAGQMIGRELVYNDSLHVTVAGIVRDWTGNTDFPYKEFLSLSTASNPFLRDALQLEQRKGIPFSSRVLLKLDKGAKADKMQATITALFNKNWQSSITPAVKLQPLSDVHFTVAGGATQIQTAHLPTLYALMTIAGLILLLAIINYINLATAQAISRDKSIGIHKVLGSRQGRLMVQFLVETLLVTMIAAGLTVWLVKPVLTLFQSFLPAGLQFHPASPATWVLLGAIIITTTLLAGLYPAKQIASLKPVSSLLRMSARKGNEKWYLRKGLIVFQFSIALVFIICAVVIGRQIRYMLDTDFGFRSDAIVLFDTDDRDHMDRVKLLQEKISRLPGVVGVARENMPPMGLDRGFFGVQYQPLGEERLPVAGIKADDQFIPLYGMRLLAGRNLLTSDTLKEVVINESLSKLLGFKKPEQAVGQIINTWNKNVPIVGVVADFHQASFHEAIKPQLIAGLACTDMAVKLELKGKPASTAKTTLARIEQQWKALYPEVPFEYTFLEEEIARLYKKEQTTAWLMKIATGITIFISCMGLFGLTLFSAEKRTREIGIRKVLGATVFDIMVLMSRDFLMPVLLAFIIAAPIAWYYVHYWLSDFVYRIQVSWWLFVLSGFTAITIALITVSYLALKAALANPVKALRIE